MLVRHVQRASLIFGAIVAALLFFIGGAALRLLMGPISLGPFTGVIEDALNHSVSGVVIRFDQAVIEWSRTEGKVNLIVLGTKVFDLNGHIVAQAPKADLDFDAAAMVEGRLDLKRFSLVGVQLTGIRSKEGKIQLGFGRDKDEPDLLETIRNILQNSASGGGSLNSFAIRNARLAFRDEPTGLFIVSPETSFALDNKGDHFDASLDSAVEVSGVPSRVSARAVLSPDGVPEKGTVEIKGLSLPALTRNSANLAVLKPYRLISDVTASFAFDKDGALTTSSFRVNGSGSIENSALNAPLLLSAFEAKGSFDAPAHRLNLDAVSFDSKPAALKGKAALVFGWNEDTLQSVSVDLDTDSFRLDLPAWFNHPRTFSRFSLQAVYDRSDRKLTWQRAVVKTGSFSADLSGAVRLGSTGSPALVLAGTIDTLSVSDALEYWPVGVSDGARDWIGENIPEGRVGPFRLDADLPAGALDAAFLPDAAMTVTFPFEAMTAHYIAGMTPITGGRGEAKLTGDAFRVSVAAASVGPLAITDGEFMIPDLHTPGVLSSIKAHGEGTMAQVLRLIDEKPLGYAKRFGIDPATVQGRASVDLDFGLPLLKDLALEQIRIGVQAKASDLALPIDNRKFEHGIVSFAIDSKSLVSQGTATLNTVPVSFKWTEDFEAAGATTHVDLLGKLDETARAHLNLSEPKWLTGTMPVTLALTGRRFRFSDAAVTADLTDAAAVLPALNFAKRAGVRANATAELRFGEAGAITVNDLVVTGEGLNARGGLSFDGDGRFLKVSLSQFRSGINDFAMDAEPLAGGGLAFRIQGKTLDASHYFADPKKKTPNAAPAADTESELQDPFLLNAKVDKLLFHDDVAFRDVTLALSLGRNERLNGLSLDALGTGKGKVTARMNVVQNVRNLSLDTDDAGAFMDAFMGFSSIRNGAFTAKITFPSDVPSAVKTPMPPPDYQGTVTFTDIVVTDQPFIARLFSAGSLAGPLRLLQGQGIPLTTVSVPFSARAKMVTIREGRAAGPAIGATFSGTLDRKSERVDLSGTLVPVYGLNSFLGAVPILGELLVSKKGEGIFGLTYAMKGNLNEPTVSVNPLSVLTPGIFRRIFEFATPKEPMPLPTPPPQATVEAAPETAPAAPQ